jgi:hypothetical protein
MPSRFTALETMAIISHRASALIFPWPPKRLVPPMTTAAMTVSSMPSPARGLPRGSR